MSRHLAYLAVLVVAVLLVAPGNLRELLGCACFIGLWLYEHFRGGWRA